MKLAEDGNFLQAVTYYGILNAMVNEANISQQCVPERFPRFFIKTFFSSFHATSVKA